MSIYSLSIENQDGTQQSMADYTGKVLLIVNTATGCGFTPQYEGLQSLFETYQSQGFEVLDFPCNQFKEQAPGNAEEINQFCQLHYNTTFKRFKKVDVNGENTAPLFSYLKHEKRGLLTEDIKWNFTKFLVDRNGKVIARYAPQTNPKEIEKDILALL